MKTIKNIQHNPKDLNLNLESRVLDITPEEIKNMSLSIKNSDNTIIQDVVIDQNSNVISGVARVLGAIENNITLINCKVIHVANEDERLMLEIESNLVQRELTAIQKGKLFSLQKKLYIKKYPNSTKEAKSKNNAKLKEDREELPESFENHMASELGVSAKSISNLIRFYEKINGTNTELLNRLLKHERNIKIQNIELDAISNMSVDEMVSLSEKLDERSSLKKNEIKELINESTKENHFKKLSDQEIVQQVFLYDLSKLITTDSKLKPLKEKLEFDEGIASKFKQSKKLDFTNTIQLILENLK